MNTQKISVSYVLIACCTYKRPKELSRLLNSLCEINLYNNIRIEVLIVDNDSFKSAEMVVDNFKNKSLVIHYIIEENKGLSNARNRVLIEAEKLKASHIAFIDDDEIPDIYWLTNHIIFYNKFEKIYISSGPTYKKFEGNYPDFIINNKMFKINTTKRLGAYRKTCASGNVFFPLNIITENNMRFNEKFNFSGSEDTDFFGRLSKLGYAIGWNNNAINYEIIDKERANIMWIIKRAFYNGYSVSIIRFSSKEILKKRFLYILEKSIIVIFNILIVLISILFGLTVFLNSLTCTAKNIGKLIGAISLKPIIYYKGM